LSVVIAPLNGSRTPPISESPVPRRFRRAARSLILLACVASTFFSCSESTPDSPNGSDGTGGSGAVVSCIDDPRVDAGELPISKQGASGKLGFELVQTDPSPPLKGNNLFVVRASNPDGSPVTGTLSLTLKMPDHGHSASTLPKPVLDAETSSYALDPVTLFMAGVWELGLEMKSDAADGASDSVSFYFCVEG